MWVTSNDRNFNIISSYFPILADIYASPVLNQAVTVFPTNKGMVTIPRITVSGSVLQPDNTTRTFDLPREETLARGAAEVLNVVPNVANNLFTMSAGAAFNMTTATNRINKRYLLLQSLNVTDTACAGSTYNIAIGVRPDARGHFNKVLVNNDTAGAPTTFTIQGDVNFDTGVVQYSVTSTGGTALAVYTPNHIATNVIFSPITGDIGRVKVTLASQGWDVNIDVHDDFEINLQQETIQDFRDIYNVDVVRTLSMAIKQQVMLNKDFDISFFLQAAEPDMLALGSGVSVDLAAYASGGAKGFQPDSVRNIFAGVMPALATVNRSIQRNHRAAPQYLLTGYRAGAMLESLQEFSTAFIDNKNGAIGASTSADDGVSFRKQTIVTSGAIPNDTIYVVYKGPADDLSRSALIDLVYQPLYIQSEVTNSISRNFVKSRTAIELARPEAVGYIKLVNAVNYLY